MDEKESFKIFVYMLAFLILGLGGMYVISNQAKAQTFYLSQQPPVNTISVSGESKLKVSPDLSQISFTIETNDTDSAKTAQEENSKLTEKVKNGLISAGVDSKDITTTQYSVEPIKRSRWVCPDREIKNCEYYDRIYYEDIIGYKTVHSLFVKSGDTTKAGSILDAIITGAGSKATVNSVSFGLKDETKKQLEKELLEKASFYAKDKAQKIASGMGVSLGKPTDISESLSYPVYYNYNYAQYGKAQDAAMVPQAQVFGGEVDVTASVSATFEIK